MFSSEGQRLGNERSSSTVDEQEEKMTRIDRQKDVCSVAFLDGKHIVSGGREQEVRCWRVKDGTEVGNPMDAGGYIYNIVVSRDGKWLVSVAGSCGLVSVWNVESRTKVTAFTGHSNCARAVDVSPDGTRIVTGSEDRTACVWSRETGQRLLGPLRHASGVTGVKFSPDRHLVATATFDHDSVQVYDTQDGRLLVNVPIRASSWLNQSLAWTSDSKQLFVLSSGGKISCLDVSTGATCFQWPIHSNIEPTCIVLATNGTFIAASAGSSVSFWDVTTRKQIGFVDLHTSRAISMAVSANCGLTTGGGDMVTFHGLRNIIPPSYYDHTSCEEVIYEEMVMLRCATEECLDSKITRLEDTNQQLRDQLSDSRKTIESLLTTNARLEQQIHTQHAEMDSLVRILHLHELRHKCEALHAENRIVDAAVSLLEITNAVSEEVRANSPIMDWIIKFKFQCISMLEDIGDEALNAEKHDHAATAYSTALLLTPSTPGLLLTKWVTTALIHSSLSEVLSAAAKFGLSSFVTYRTICDVLEKHDRVLEAIQCFQQNILDIGTKPVDDVEWVADFKARSLEILEQRGDRAMESASYKDAIDYYATALAIDPLSVGILKKRSKARALIESWQDSLEDADAAIKLDPSSPCGYERRRAALLGAHRYDEATDTHNDMLLRLEQSPDPHIRRLRDHYVSPSQTIAAIRDFVKRTQRDAPPILINTETGRIHDECGRLDEFEADPTFKELVASMTTGIDHSQIAQTVYEYFRYGTFSHTWEGAESLFHDVLNGSVHNLAPSPTALKLVMFCVTLQEAGLRWAWSDACCINKSDRAVLQESLTSMFQWYHESALTIVHLKGVLSDSELGALMRSIWNTRAWPLQEFLASKVIRFYTEDWRPYLPQESAYNHKESPMIMAEMAAATGVDVQALLSLKPGSENVRQKLCLAATRIATKQEDIAYSLFGIFNVSIPVNYGEGQQHALGRLLQEVLTCSGDVTILAWTGRASDYNNSALPAEIGAYRQPASPYVPSMVEEDTMETLISELRTSSYLDSAMMLYDRVIFLPFPRHFKHRLSLSCIKFPLRSLSPLGNGSLHVFRGVTSALGNVEIKTREDLSGMKNLVLVHPWLQCLLDPTVPLLSDEDELLTPLDEDGGTRDADGPPPSPSYTTSASLDKPTKALRLFARLRQPFGALLLVRLSHNEYQRVASDHPIVVQLLKNVTPRYLLDKIQTLDIV